MLTEEEALAATDEQDDACSCCRKPYAAHCQDCWHCPGTHDEMCGF